MQNYQNFIDELFRLEIDTVQYFVKDEQVLYDTPVRPYADAPADRLPGHLATFMNLDQYDQHQPENRYKDTLVELQRRAVTDLLLLEPAQTNRVLSDAKSKCEQLTQLSKNALEYQKAWDYGTLDLLPACFLELRLLDSLTIKSRPQASPHHRFAHYLTDAIAYKRGILSGFIRQVETTLQPAPTVLLDTTQEPEYDMWYIENDDAYAFDKLRELAIYLPTIEPFTKRVEWFFETSHIWDIEPCFMGTGWRTIPNPEHFCRVNEQGKAVDKAGQPVEKIAWGMTYDNDEEKGILRKLYFLRFYRPNVVKLSHRPCYDIAQLLSRYDTHRQTERGKRLQREWVIREISERQQLINDWIGANPDTYGNPEIKRQLQNAALLIEQELEEIPAIKWELFYRIKHLDPFALLWGLVEYKRFLETEELTAPATSTPPPPAINPSFDTYIVEGQRAKLIPYLVMHYSNATPEQCGFMLYALANLTHLPPSALNRNQTALHRAMEKTFGSIGTRQALNTAILRLDPKGSSDEDKRNIAEHTQRISQFLTPPAAE